MESNLNPAFLELAEILEMQAEQIDRYGGTHGSRDQGALESAIGVPQASFGEQWLQPTLPAMAAAYLFHLCQNHAFLDGNKRIGANAAIVFLHMNDWELNVSEDELVELVLGVASGVIAKPELTAVFHRACRHAPL